MAAFRANMLFDLEALADIASGSRPAELVEILYQSQRVLSSGMEYALFEAGDHTFEAQNLRGFRSMSNVGVGVQSLGSTTLVGGLEAEEGIGQRLADGQAVGQNVLGESLPPVNEMVQSAGTADVLGAYLEIYPSRIADRDLNGPDASAGHRNKKQADKPKVTTRGDGFRSYKRTEKTGLKGKGEGLSMRAAAIVRAQYIRPSTGKGAADARRVRSQRAEDSPSE